MLTEGILAICVILQALAIVLLYRKASNTDWTLTWKLESYSKQLDSLHTATAQLYNKPLDVEARLTRVETEIRQHLTQPPHVPTING